MSNPPEHRWPDLMPTGHMREIIEAEEKRREDRRNGVPTKIQLLIRKIEEEKRREEEEQKRLAAREAEEGGNA